jgi:hypothetical protein
MNKNIKVLFIDIETSPLLSYCWGLFDQNIALNQIHKDWHLLSFSALWLGDPPNKIIYHDQRNAKDIEDDKELLKKIWKLLDEADVVIGQNSKQFDIKKLNTRFIMNGFQPPSSYRQIDTLSIAKKYFGFTSNKLAYMTDKLCTKYKKLEHRKYSGFELWRECLKGNKAAFNEMEKYNKYDVLSLQELYTKLIPWDRSINFNVYHDKDEHICKCGKTDFRSKGYHYTNNGKYARYKCKNCGAEVRSKTNLFTIEKRESLGR